MVNRLAAVFENRQEVGTKEEAADVIQFYKRQPLPRTEYLIGFTPRSGSSWLTEIISSTGLLGRPDEWLNPDNVPFMIEQKYPCSDIDVYLDCLRRSEKSKDDVCFGIEASWFQWKLLMDLRDWKSVMDISKFVYLYRADLVAQAISLYRATETGYFHSVQRNITEEKKKTELAYDPKKIWRWVVHILQQEYGWNLFFWQNDLPYLKLTYEEFCSSPQLAMLRLLVHIRGEACVADSVEIKPVTSTHNKISNTYYLEMGLRFYRENSSATEFCLENRGRLSGSAFVGQLHLS